MTHGRAPPRPNLAIPDLDVPVVVAVDDGHPEAGDDHVLDLQADNAAPVDSRVAQSADPAVTDEDVGRLNAGAGQGSRR